MATIEKNLLNVDLYKNKLQEESGDYYGRVRSAGTLHNEQIAQRVAKERTEYRTATVINILEICDQVKRQAIAEGKTVIDGLGMFYLTTKGKYVGENAQYNASINTMNIGFSPNKTLREMVENSDVVTNGTKVVGPVINSVIDSTTGVENGELTSGGPAVIKGKNIKLLGEDESVGITLTADEADAQPIAISLIVHNNPSELTVILPVLDTNKSYWLDLTTQYSSGNKAVKTPRTYRFPILLGKQSESEPEEDRPVVQ